MINSCFAFAFLRMHLSKGDTEALFSEFDSHPDLKKKFAVKFAVLLNNPGDDKLLEKAKNELIGYFEKESGITELQGEESKEGENELIRGAVDIMGYLGDTFVRRFGDAKIIDFYYSLMA